MSTHETTTRSRRTALLWCVAGVVLGLVVGGGLMFAANPRQDAPPATTIATATVPFYGAHQAGIETPAQANATFVTFDLLDGKSAVDVGRLMRLWTNSSAKLTSGAPIIGDSIAELAENPASMTITFGFGYSLFAKTGRTDEWPLMITDLPHFTVDELEQRWSGGDFVVQVAGDNPLSVFHAVHEITRDAAPFAKVRWQQRGFLNPAGIDDGKIGRNLMGQVDGIANAPAGSPEFAERTWSTAPASLAGGSVMVVRRIRMNLDTWDLLGAGNKEKVIGREHSDGAPITGGEQRTPMDLGATDASGKPVIPDKAHGRLAFTDSNAGITRRGYNYDDGFLADGGQDAGLIFTSFQATADRFIAIQRMLDGMDELNRWTTPVGSALFIAPPGTSEGGWIGETFFE